MGHAEGFGDSETTNPCQGTRVIFDPLILGALQLV